MPFISAGELNAMRAHAIDLENRLASAKAQIANLEAQMTPEMHDAVKASERVSRLNHAVSELGNQVRSLNATVARLTAEESEKRASVRELEEREREKLRFLSRRIPLVLEGDQKKGVYVYLSAPLKGTRKGSTFYVDVVNSSVQMTSELTGSTWDPSLGGVALARDGMPFGVTWTSEKTLRDFVRMGYSVQVKAKRIGMYSETIPEVVLMMPDYDELAMIRRMCRAFRF